MPQTKFQKFIIWSIFGIVVWTAASLILAFWINSKFPITDTQVTHQPKKQPAVSEIDISNWQTYRNEEYGFEFKYPKEWRYEIKYPNNWTARESAQIVWISDVDKNNRIMVNTYPNYDSGVTLDGISSWVEAVRKIDCSGVEGPCFESQIHKREKEEWIFQNKEIVKVMNKDAWQYTYKLGDKISRIIYAAFADSKGVEHIFEIELLDKVGDTTETTNQILSTFKFLD